MTRKQIDRTLEGSPTYRHATPACRAHFALLCRGTRVPIMDTTVRSAWFWFWLGWYRR